MIHSVLDATIDHLQLIYRDLATLLEECLTEDCNASLFCGDWGLLLYLFYYEHYIDPEADHAGHLLQKLYQQLSENGSDGYTYCNGITGPFWMLRHLTEFGIAAIDIDDLAGGLLPPRFPKATFILKKRTLTSCMAAPESFIFLSALPTSQRYRIISAGLCRGLNQ